MLGARSRHCRGSIIGEFMQKARVKQVEVGKWKLTESVESFLRFALRDSNFSNALFKVTVDDGERWKQVSVVEALSLVNCKAEARVYLYRVWRPVYDEKL